jgi:imidazolonepropionase-like amidohydrolase
VPAGSKPPVFKQDRGFSLLPLALWFVDKTILRGGIMRVQTLVAVLLATFGGAGFGLASWATDTIIHAGTLIAEPGKPPQTSMSVFIKDGRIEKLERGFQTAPGAQIIDLKGAHVLPGLIDSHVHLTSELGPDSRMKSVTQSDADFALEGAGYAMITLLAGFTTVQDVGGRGEDAIFALRDAIAAGRVAGPRIRASGMTVSPTGGHGDPANGWSAVVAASQSRDSICDGADDCRRATRVQIRKGADLIKITATGGVLSNTATGTEQQFANDELIAIVDAARSMGRSVTAHAHGKAGIEAALKAGVASIEHGTYLDSETIALFKKYDAVLVPTVLAGATVASLADSSDWMSPAQRAKSRAVGPLMLDMLRRARMGGVRIAYGTDTGVSRHGDNARELLLMVEAGFSPALALRSATVEAARHLQLADEIGTIEVGKVADIIAVDADPLSDISAMLDVDFVMAKGKVHKAPN